MKYENIEMYEQKEKEWITEAAHILYTKKQNAAIYIQRIWRMVIANPKYEACKNRLKWEFSNFTKEISQSN